MNPHTVVIVDLVGYGGAASTIEQSVGVAAVGGLNDAIQEFIVQALGNTCDGSRSDLVLSTGDGALLRFDQPDDALIFAAVLQEATRAHNAGKTESLAKRVFRIGIGTGELILGEDLRKASKLAGMAIVRAARLEAKAAPGEALIDGETWEKASIALRAAYRGPERIEGKRGEVFVAFRAILNPDGPMDVAHLASELARRTDRQRPNHAALMDQIREKSRTIRAPQSDLLMLMLDIPNERRPSSRLTLEEQMVAIMQWAKDEDALQVLRDELVNIVGAGPGAAPMID